MTLSCIFQFYCIMSLVEVRFLKIGASWSHQSTILFDIVEEVDFLIIPLPTCFLSSSCSSRGCQSVIGRSRIVCESWSCGFWVVVESSWFIIEYWIVWRIVKVWARDASVAKVLFRTAPENQNRQNQTIKFGSVLFSPRNSWSCSVLGSYIWEDIQNRVRTGSNWTSSDIILCFQTEAAVCLSECHLFFLFLFGQHGNRRTTLKPW